MLWNSFQTSHEATSRLYVCQCDYFYSNSGVSIIFSVVLKNATAETRRLCVSPTLPSRLSLCRHFHSSPTHHVLSAASTLLKESIQDDFICGLQENLRCFATHTCFIYIYIKVAVWSPFERTQHDLELKAPFWSDGGRPTQRRRLLTLPHAAVNQ